MNFMNSDVRKADELHVELKKAPLKKDLVWTMAIIQRVSGRVINGLVKVRLVKGTSPNGQKEFLLKGTEKVSLILSQGHNKKKNKKK